MEIAIVPATRAELGQAIIRQHLQSHGTHLTGVPAGGHDVGIAIRSRAIYKPGTILLSRHGGSTRGHHTDDFKRLPGLFLSHFGLLPFRNLLQNFRAV